MVLWSILCAQALTGHSTVSFRHGFHTAHGGGVNVPGLVHLHDARISVHDILDRWAVQRLVGLGAAIIGKTWLQDSILTTGYTRFPSKLIVPSNLWPVANNASQPVFAAWIEKLATLLNATGETTSIGEYWNATANQPGTDFFDHMSQVVFDLNWKTQREKVIEPFQADYAARHGGRKPFLNPFPAARLASAANVAEADVAESYERPPFQGLSYRNTQYSSPDVSSWSSFLMYYYSVQSQGPAVVFPIGLVSYTSNIFFVAEKLPVSIDVLAHRGCDLMLLDLAAYLADAELGREVKTGRELGS